MSGCKFCCSLCHYTAVICVWESMFRLPITMPKTLNYLMFEDSNSVTAPWSTQLSVGAKYVPSFPSFEYSWGVIFKLLTVNLLLLIAKRKNMQPTKTPATTKKKTPNTKTVEVHCGLLLGFFLMVKFSSFL